jgi:REP element-mobilizing transposase RayT
VTRQLQVSAGGVCDLGYQVVGCPKYHPPVLAGPVEGRGEELIGANASGHGWRLVALEFMPDHVHLFVKAHRSDFPSWIADSFKGLHLAAASRVRAHAVTSVSRAVPAVFRADRCGGCADRATIRWHAQ